MGARPRRLLRPRCGYCVRFPFSALSRRFVGGWSALAAGFVCDGLQWIIRDMNSSAERILGAYTPRHLQGQVAGIAAMDKFVNAVCMPASILIDRRVLSTAWHPLEMPTTYMVSDG